MNSIGDIMTKVRRLTREDNYICILKYNVCNIIFLFDIIIIVNIAGGSNRVTTGR